MSKSQEGTQQLQEESKRFVKVLPLAVDGHMVIVRAVDVCFGRSAVEDELLDRRLGIAGQSPDVVDRNLVAASLDQTLVAADRSQFAPFLDHTQVYSS